MNVPKFSPPPEPHVPSRRTMLRLSLYAGVALLLAFALLYGALWLPYQDPRGGDFELEDVRRLSAPASGHLREHDEPAASEWVDREAGVVRIPIEDAMKIQTEKLPVRRGADEAAAERKRRAVPTDAGSGRPARRP